jgi:uncharacterized protein (TIGR03435 family)
MRDLSRNTIRLVIGVILTAALLLSAPRQNSARRLSFEVASVRERTSGTERSSTSTRGDRFIATNYTLQDLLLLAYGTRQKPLFTQQVVGGPGWTTKDGFDIEARAEQALATEEQIHLMLQSLLEDRFQLVLHHELRELSTYDLVVAKPGKLKASEDQTVPNKVQEVSPSPVAGLIQGAKPRGRAAMWMSSAGISLGGMAITLEAFADLLQVRLGRPVIDRTKVEGLFDIDLMIRPRGAALPADTSETSAIFAVLEPDLGLRLESKRTEVDVLVIDSVQKPSSN